MTRQSSLKSSFYQNSTMLSIFHFHYQTLEEATMEEGTVPTEKVVDHVEMVRQFAKQVKMNEPNMKTVTAEDVADAVLNIVAQAPEIDVQRLMSFRAPIIELLTQTGKEGNEWKTDIPTSSSAD